jgi:hypothetical protein
VPNFLFRFSVLIAGCFLATQQILLLEGPAVARYPPCRPYYSPSNRAQTRGKDCTTTGELVGGTKISVFSLLRYIQEIHRAATAE